MNLRKYAKGQPCMIRSEHCNWNPETTVLAHIRTANIAGLGQKPSDALGAWACSGCHDLIDGRTTGFEDINKLKLDGLVRTLDALVKAKIIKW